MDTDSSFAEGKEAGVPRSKMVELYLHSPYIFMV
jgi:hypothetical protein